MSSKYLDAKGMATELGISVDQAKGLITEGHIPAIDTGIKGRSYWRVAREDLDRWIEQKRAETAARFGGAA